MNARGLLIGLLDATLLPWLLVASAAESERPDLQRLAGQAADVGPSAYTYLADRSAEQNPPESRILLLQYANLPFEEPVDIAHPALKQVLCGMLWEEVRPVRRVTLAWPADSARRPPPDELVVSYFDATDGTAHTWWNPRSLSQAKPPTVSPDGRTYEYSIPVDTWGVVVAVRGQKPATAFAVPQLAAFVPEVWKQLELEIEWGFDPTTAALEYDGRIEAYDGRLADVRPLAGDAGTTLTGPTAWRSAAAGSARRGVRLNLAYIGSSRWRRTWPYHAQPEDVARTIVTVWTKAGSFSFLASDLELGPILAPEYGFFVRALGKPAAQPAAAPAPAAIPAPQLLGDKLDAIPGVPKVRGWATQILPWFGVNPDCTPGAAGSLTIPARSVAMHPTPDRDVAVGWNSPFSGRVSIRGQVALADAVGGNGIEWSLVLDRQTRRQVLARGAVNTGGTQAFAAGAGGKTLAEVAVQPGDLVSLVLGAKDGNHSCDTTLLNLAIAEIGGTGRLWDLAPEILDNIHAGNPHADSRGQAGVWRFYSAAAAPPPPAVSEPPFRMDSTARTAREFRQELTSRGLKTVRQRTREHAEQTWAAAVAALHPGETLPPHPQPEFEPVMKVQVPCPRLTAQWKLGTWHILRRSVRDAAGRWQFNDFPFGILASETYMLLRALDLQGQPREAADGLDQWLRLPVQPLIVPGQGGHHSWALPDRPLGHFADGRGCLTHATGPPGAGGHMDGVHSMGPGAIMFTLLEHFRLTGDREWLKQHAPRLLANAEWILRQRQVLAQNLPGGSRLWSKGLQPAHVVTPDSERMQMQFYESEAYYWLAVHRLAEALTLIDPTAGAKLAAEAEAYRQDLVAAVARSIALTPVVPVRDGTYHSFIPFAPYVRGFAAGAWGWRRCQGHVGAIYWDTVQSADPLISPAGLLAPLDRRVQGHLDVLEDRLLLENTKVAVRTPGFEAEKHWFSHASWQYQCGLERHANIHLAADDPPNFIRSLFNQYAVDIMPGEYTFREHTTGGPPDKIYEESCFLERFRQMLVMEDGQTLWLARATPRAWLEPGRKIAVRNAPTHFGTVAFEIESAVDQGQIRAVVELPTRDPPSAVLLRIRHPRAAPIRAVQIDGQPWQAIDADKEVIRLDGLRGRVKVTVAYP